MALKWLFLDMNAFFASVEQQEHPELRGRPIAVVPVVSDHTCCIAVSYEAKAFGIKTGTNVGEARRLCPHIILVEAKHDPYRAYSDEIVRVVEDCLPVAFKPYVDEMYCKLWANEQRTEDALRMGQHVKDEIKRRVGKYMHCSVGLSVTPFLAKVASELQKPNGLVVLDECDLPQALYGLKLTDFPGVSRRMEERFYKAFVYNTEQMCDLTVVQMRAIWGGVMGERWWRHLRGLPVDDLPTTRRCVSHSHVLPPELRTDAGAAAVAGRLLEKAAERLRYLGYHTRGCCVWAAGPDRQTWSRKARLAPCQDTWTLMAAMRSLWEHPFSKPKQVGVVLYDVLPNSHVTLPLFGEQEQRLAAARAVDQINQRFGRGRLSMASVRPVAYTAEDKICFGKIAEIA